MDKWTKEVMWLVVRLSAVYAASVLAFAVLIYFLVAALDLGDDYRTVRTDNPVPESGCYVFVAGWSPVAKDGTLFWCEYRESGVFAYCEPEPVDCPQ